MMWRHGDVLVAVAENIPEGAKPRPGATLAYGEITGHSHRIAEPNAVELFDHQGTMFMRVVAPQATLVHEEHQPIVFPQGTYRVWMQREYTPGSIRRVID
jgi:hypothetical protein